MAPHAGAIIHQLAAHQRGLLTPSQAFAAGVSRRQLTRRIEAGELERLAPQVLRLVGSEPTNEQGLVAACLDAGGAAVSHHTALAHWGLSGWNSPTLHVTRRRGVASRPRTPHLAQVHQPRRLLEQHLVDVGRGLVVTTPTRTLLDVAGMPHVAMGRVARAMDSLLAERLTSVALLQRTLDELAGRGRPGITLMRVLIGERVVGYRPPESGLEARFQVLARQVPGLRFERQVEVGSSSQWLGRVDFIDRLHRLVVQVDHSRWHTSLLDARHDADQTAALIAAGYRVLRFDEIDIWHRDRHVVQQLSDALNAMAA